MTEYCDLGKALVASPEACKEANFTASKCLADLKTAACRSMTDVCDFDSKCVSCYAPDSVCFACERGYYLVQGYCVEINTDATEPKTHYVFFTRNFAEFESNYFLNTASWFSGTNSGADVSYDPLINSPKWGDFDVWSPFPNQV